MQDYEIKLLKLSGKITRKLLDYGSKLIKPGVSDLEVVLKIEEKLNEISQKLKDKGILNNEKVSKAFPVNISVNDIAAHYTPFDREYFFKENDMVKLDLGVSIDGYIADSAITVYLGDNKELKRLKEASKKAVENVEKMLKKGTKIQEIGKIIEETIKKEGFNPIYNLGGHSIEKNVLHSGIFIPNYDNKDNKEIKEGVYAIEPFATNGIGEVRDFSFSNIVILKETKARIPLTLRKNYQLLKESFGSLPFSLLDLKLNFNWDEKKIKNVISLLERFGLIHKYPILIEKTKGMVSQHEHTFVVLEDKIITTTKEELPF